MERSRWMLVLATLALLAWLPSALAACGGAATATPLYPLLPTSTPAPTITDTPTTPPTPSPTATLTAYAPPCLTSQLRLSFQRGGAAMSEAGAQFAFTNVSSTACSLQGFANLRLLDGDGRPMAIKIEQAASAFLWTVPVNKVQLPPGGAAYFETQSADAPMNGDVCVTAASTTIYPPQNTVGLASSFQLGTCAGVIYVSPVVAQPNQL